MVQDEDTREWSDAPTENIGAVSTSNKFLKDPFNFRYMVASADIYLTPLSVLTAQVWGAVRLEAIELWTEAFPGVPCLLVLSGDQILPKIEDLNRIATSKTTLRCYDVKQYYTNVPLQDLHDKLGDVAEMVFARGTATLTGGNADPNNEYETCLIIHSKSSGKKHEWRRLTPAQAAGAKFSKATKAISITQALRMAHIIIFNIYFWLGNVIMLQTIGIPMGANPSPAFADLYLYAYEYAFALQLWATAAGRDILCRFLAVVQCSFSG